MATRELRVAVPFPFDEGGSVTLAACGDLAGVTDRGRGLTEGAATLDMFLTAMGVAALSFGCGEGEGIWEDI